MPRSTILYLPGPFLARKPLCNFLMEARSILKQAAGYLKTPQVLASPLLNRITLQKFQYLEQLTPTARSSVGELVGHVNPAVSRKLNVVDINRFASVARNLAFAVLMGTESERS